MDYNDFKLIENYENMAREYYSSMQNKGYVFKRLDDNQEKRKQQAKTTLATFDQILSGYNYIFPFLKNKEKDFLKKLQTITELQKQTLAQIYNIETTEIVSRQNIKKVISKESLLLEKLLTLLFLEEDENFTLIKNMIFERLSILKED